MIIRNYGPVWSGRLPVTEEIAGSNPASSAILLGDTMFHVLVKGDKVRAEEYEEAYRYSTYTSGGGYWSGAWAKSKDCLGSEPTHRLTIFETKASAEKIAKEFNESKWKDDKEDVKAIPLFQLEDYLKEV